MWNLLAATLVNLGPVALAAPPAVRCPPLLHAPPIKPVFSPRPEPDFEMPQGPPPVVIRPKLPQPPPGETVIPEVQAVLDAQGAPGAGSPPPAPPRPAPLPMKSAPPPQ